MTALSLAAFPPLPARAPSTDALFTQRFALVGQWCQLGRSTSQEERLRCFLRVPYFDNSQSVKLKAVRHGGKIHLPSPESPIPANPEHTLFDLISPPPIATCQVSINGTDQYGTQEIEHHGDEGESQYRAPRSAARPPRNESWGHDAAPTAPVQTPIATKPTRSARADAAELFTQGALASVPGVDLSASLTTNLPFRSKRRQSAMPRTKGGRGGRPKRYERTGLGKAATPGW